jgi:predicted Zn finger-like uncharacterized protein
VSLVTRCPACGTAFRVQREQLAARAGKVRCGKCGGVFDGVSGLVVQGAAPLVLEPSPQLGLFDPSRRASEPDAASEGALPGFLAGDETPRRLSLGWALASLAAAAVLAGQAALHYRTEIALLAPQAQPLLEAACEQLGCALRLPRRPELMSIESSDLQTDPRREGVIVLNAAIRNRAAFAQEYPALELTLTDEADRPVLRRVLLPADYLQAGRAPGVVARGMAAGAEAQLRLHLDASGARATGYRLYLFYP